MGRMSLPVTVQRVAAVANTASGNTVWRIYFRAPCCHPALLTKPDAQVGKEVGPHLIGRSIRYATASYAGRPRIVAIEVTSRNRGE